MNKRIHDYEWLRRNIMAISFTCGFLVALYGISLKASEYPEEANRETATITIDVNNPQQSINYNEVNKFISAQDVNTIKFAAKDSNVIILSEKPIVITKPYAPTSFADLGLRLSRSAIFVKTSPFEVAINNVRSLPTIPPFTATPTQPTVVVAAKQVEQKKQVQPETFTQELSAAQPAIFSIVLWFMTAVSTLAILGMLLASRRRTDARKRSLRYSGELGRATDMIGNGRLFDFSHEARNGKMSSANTTCLNLLWHLGRFSKSSAIDTYFYIAFYIPNQQGYARTLRKTVVKKEKTT